MKNSVSVVVPLYGNVHLDRFRLVVESILSQKGVSLELIAAGLNGAAKVGELSRIDIPKEEVPEMRYMGRVINNGLHSASGDFTYVTDADILLTNLEYLKDLVQEFYACGKFLKRPPMRRLLLQDFDWFRSVVNETGLEKSLDSLDFSQGYLVKPTNAERLMRIFRKFENGRDKTFIISEEDFQKYISDKTNKGSEPLYFTQERHCGAVFAPTKAFSEVGGYHEGFVSWGVWDADVQWKLEHRGGMNLIPTRKRFEVIHLDHSRGYFDRDKWAHDKLLQESRRKLGAEKCIEGDIKNYFEGEHVK